MRNVDKKYHYLYKTTNLINGKYYYGMHSSSNLDDEYLGSGKRLRNSIRKYGKENFKREILEMFDSREELIKGEIELITEDLLNDSMCMNLRNGGTGGYISAENQFKRAQAGGLKAQLVMSDEAKFKRSQKAGLKTKLLGIGIHNNENRYDWTGKTRLESTKEKISNSMKGKQTGNRNSQFGSCWITRDNENKKIKSDDLDLFLSQGWIKGRKTK